MNLEIENCFFNNIAKLDGIAEFLQIAAESDMAMENRGLRGMGFIISDIVENLKGLHKTVFEAIKDAPLAEN